MLGDQPTPRQLCADRSACAAARRYLLRFADVGVSNSVLKLYLDPSTASLRPTSLSEIYKRVLESAKNRGMSAGVIGAALGGVERLRPILCDFDPHRVVLQYDDDWRRVLRDIRSRLRPRGKMREAPRSIWPLFCRTVTSAASFLSQFASSDEFYAWVKVFDRDDRTRPALPMILSHEIDGFGFPLACDFLKELGYVNFGKPDVHVKAIFRGLGLASEDADDYEVFKAITRVAKSDGVTPYHVDKLFWLVGSGHFYENPEIGRQGRISTDRAAFIRKTASEMK